MSNVYSTNFAAGWKNEVIRQLHSKHVDIVCRAIPVSMEKLLLEKRMDPDFKEAWASADAYRREAKFGR